MRFPLRSPGDQQGSADGAQDAFGLHALHLGAGQALGGQGALDAVGGLPPGLGQQVVVVEQGHGMVRGFLCCRSGFCKGEPPVHPVDDDQHDGQQIPARGVVEHLLHLDRRELGTDGQGFDVGFHRLAVHGGAGVNRFIPGEVLRLHGGGQACVIVVIGGLGGK
jgi:hypothetical protein